MTGQNCAEFFGYRRISLFAQIWEESDGATTDIGALLFVVFKSISEFQAKCKYSSCGPIFMSRLRKFRYSQASNKQQHNEFRVSDGFLPRWCDACNCSSLKVRKFSQFLNQFMCGKFFFMNPSSSKSGMITNRNVDISTIVKKIGYQLCLEMLPERYWLNSCNRLTCQRAVSRSYWCH